MWKQKDEELVHGNFECELQQVRFSFSYMVLCQVKIWRHSLKNPFNIQAIFLSKLDYEEKKDVYKQLKKDADVEKKVEQSRSGNKKNKKKTVMSLEQFNELGNTDEDKCMFL